VHHVVVVDADHGVQHRTEDLPHVGQLHLGELEQREEFLALNELHDDEDALVVLEVLLVAHDVGLLQVEQQVQILLEHHHVFDPLFGHQLARELLRRV